MNGGRATCRGKTFLERGNPRTGYPSPRPSTLPKAFDRWGETAQREALPDRGSCEARTALRPRLGRPRPGLQYGRRQAARRTPKAPQKTRIDKWGPAWNQFPRIPEDAKECDVKTFVLSVFLGGLAVCVLTGAAILWALLLGLLCFAGYALRQGHPPRDVALMLWSGVRSVRNILIIFGLIGMLTAVWRASGTLPFIIRHTLALVDPSYFVLCVFLLCSLMSLLLGTSFGTVSTLGVILMMLARSAGLDELVTAGAILSGTYVGDRCSPMSSSAALVCVLTNTNIYDNIRRMWATSALPFALTCAGYLALSLSGTARPAPPEAAGQLDRFFILNGWTLVPAACIVVLSLFRVDVKRTMLWSILTGGAVCLFVQGMTPPELASCLAFGYSPAPGAELLAGGGVQSMLQVAGIVLLSSSYSGIFNATDLLSGFGGPIRRLAGRIGNFRAMMLASIPVSGISCNQTLAAILTAQLCRPCYARGQDMAIPLENSAILIAALIPWSIAGSVPCAALGVGMACLPYALYLYLVPLANALRKDAGPPEPAAAAGPA